MKVNLECGSNILNGYVNINSEMVDNTHVGDANFIIGVYNNLDPVLEDNSAEEIIFNPVLNCLPPSDIAQCVTHWRNKLIDGGMLVVSFTDILRVSTGIVRGDIDYQNAHNILYGQNGEIKSLTDLNNIKSLLRQLGFTIDFVDTFQITNLIRAVK